jgi:microcystin-dependent protein
MPLETASFINQLDASNPAHTDTINFADSHLKLIKSTLKATFLNFTAAALNSTQAQIDAAVAATSNGISVLADTGAFFKTNTTDGVTNPAAGEVDIKTAGVVRAQFTSAGVTTPGTFSGTHAGPGAIPIGGSMPWFTDTLPSGYGTYAWLNGQAISRTGANATLFGMLGTTYGPGDGSTTFNLPNTQEVSLYGKSGMGGATSPGCITNYVMTALGTIIGACNKVLTQANLPNVTLATTIGAGQGSHSHGFTASYDVGGTAVNTGGAITNSVNSALNTAAATLPAMSGTTPTGGSGTPVDTVSPGIAVNWIMRIA